MDGRARFLLIVLFFISLNSNKNMRTNGLSTGNPYEILGVSKSADTADIRRAYKQMAKQWHPDKNQDPSAKDKFISIRQAYELLSDPNRRKLYDQRGITNTKDKNFHAWSFAQSFHQQEAEFQRRFMWELNQRRRKAYRFDPFGKLTNLLYNLFKL